MDAYRLPKDDPGREAAIQAALIGAADVPLGVAEAALEAMKLAGSAATQGNLNAITDAMAGVHMALAAVEIAALNVRINATSLTDPERAAHYAGRAAAVVDEARALSADLLARAAERAGLGR